MLSVERTASQRKTLKSDRCSVPLIMVGITDFGQRKEENHTITGSAQAPADDCQKKG